MLKSKRKILFIIDPLKKLNVASDTSMALVREFESRGHQIWSADVADLLLEKKNLYANVQRLKSLSPEKFIQSKPLRKSVEFFDLVLLRKEPPFNASFLEMTYFFDLVKNKTLLSNDSTGIRKFNEKLSSFYFPQWMPETLISSSKQDLFNFAKKHSFKVVVKPLDSAGGTGVFKLNTSEESARKELLSATKNGKKNILLQKFISVPGKQLHDKRLIVLNGKLIAGYERRCKKGEFRANLHKGGSYHATTITPTEQLIAQKVGAFLLKEGIHFAGLDVIGGKLIEINVTCPGGILEAEILYPKIKIIQQWAKFLERLLDQQRG